MDATDRSATRGVCPDTEILAAYLDGMLDEAGRGLVEAHAADCGPCRELLADASRMATGASRARVVRWTVIGGLAAAAAIVAAVVLPRQEILGGDDGARLQALVAAVGTERPVEPRLTGGFQFAPLAGVTRGPGDATELPAAVRAAAARLEQAAHDAPSARARAGVATAEVVLGRPAQAVTLLEQAVREAPEAAELWSDLAAARLVAASGRADRAAADSALEAADRALALSPSLAEALYNRALALEAAGRLDEARRAWERCAAEEKDPAWSNDARRRAQGIAATR